MSDSTSKPPREGRGSKKGKRDISADAEIGRKLKQYYDSITIEAVPDRFAQLLGQLEQAENKSGGTE